MSGKVSIIIPIYNIEKYLKECLESVINQTYKNLDIVLVDDGSTDGSATICDEYALKDRRVRVIHKENGGLSDARNVGFLVAEGKYIYFLDGDDFIKKNAIETLVNVIELEEADIVFFEWETVYEDFDDSEYKDEIIRKHSYSTSKGTVLFDLQLKEEEFFVSVPIQFYSYDFLKRNNLQFQKGIIHEDELFTPIALIRAERAACINEQLYCRRLRANSIMSERKSKKSISGLIVCIRGLTDEIINYSQDSLEYKLLRKYIQVLLFVIYKRYYEISSKERDSIRPQLKELRNRLYTLGYLGSIKIFLKTNMSGIINLYNKIKAND